MPVQELCTVAETVRLNDYALSLTLEAPRMAALAQIGQFVHIKCGHARLLRRPISICEIGESRLRVVFEVRGSGTEWLSRRTVGDELDVLGPVGHGFRLSDDDVPLLVGGGIGVPPMLACAQKAAGNSYAVLGFRDSAHALLCGEFDKSCKEVSLATEDGSLGYKGFVTAGVGEMLDKHKDITVVFACGPKPMLNAIRQETEKRGVALQVSMEERMACGVGACLGCAILMADGSMKHVCKDGPVFDAAEVDWNG